METLLGLIIGTGLSAACGFRVFVPLLGTSIAAMSGHLHLAQGFEWVGSWPALVAFSVATLLEVAAYFIPWFDHVMDSIAAPAAVVAGTVLTASLVGDVSPFLRWSLAIIAGGAVAGTTQLGTMALRTVSSTFTGGIGNPVVSAGELAGSTVMTLLALFLSVVGFILAVVICLLALKSLRKKRLAARS